MSLRAMTLVWESAITPPSLKLTALALADWSNDEGGSLHPSISAVAKKVGVSRCQAQRHIQTLKSQGLLSVIANAHGGAPGATPRYRLHIDQFAALTGGTDATGRASDTGGIDEAGSASDTGSVDALRRIAPVHNRGSACATQTVINRHKTTRDTSSARKPTSPNCPHEQIKVMFAEILPELPTIKIWNARRQTTLKARWCETAKVKAWADTDEGLVWFRKFFETVADSDFLMGRGERKTGHEGWRCDFDFLISPKGFIGVIEGKYTNRGAP